MVEWKGKILDSLVRAVEEAIDCEHICLIDRFWLRYLLQRRSYDNVWIDSTEVKGWLFLLYELPCG